MPQETIFDATLVHQDNINLKLKTQDIYYYCKSDANRKTKFNLNII